MTYTIDGARPGTRRTCDQGIAQKKLIASFAGTGFVAEREGEELLIYLVSGDNVQTGTSDSASGPMTPAKLQQRNEAFRKRSA